MKIINKILALYIVHQNLWWAKASFIQQPRALIPTALNSSPFAYGSGFSETGSASSSVMPTNGGVVGTGEMAGDLQLAKDVWDTLSPVKVQGGSLRTWSFVTPAVERVQVLLKTDGRPLVANIDLWEGPDNTPQKMGIYIEDGCLRPFNAVIETPRHGQNAIAVYNTGHLEFPLDACVEADMKGSAKGLAAVTQRLVKMSKPKVIQGGALKTYPFEPSVQSVQILLKTDGRPLNARIELLQGPNNNKQVMEVYTEDGHERPFFVVIETPGVGNVVRIVNASPVEFPLTASVEPYLVDSDSTGVLENSWDNGDGTSGLFFLQR